MIDRVYSLLQLNSSKALIASEDGTIRPAFEIFAHALRYIKEYLLDVIERLEEIDTKRYLSIVPYSNFDKVSPYHFTYIWFCLNV